ncbi:MAG: lycopene cyclase domain-containing protein [Flavobacteriales bacterium]|nr:lycopene cyclase domain-containing protein [Flavobacteriales bacterium]MCW8913135.1 lycopene cyclase domain-containing protein [Flavobacteriales bacterium]MCW8937784.1 lycopene cyclase domain-containing protein [Flavobacteriales bacterium]MCW8940034.1 lycopene cyclase domain-containing protein [Flavobacteriales bacterium]MCW8967404.1 lycopene cyclase domain-containing protein [Flavobacteriales bacterium]
MESLYLIILLLSFSIPFAYSFEKKMHFIKHWKAVLGSISIVAIVYIVWDVIFTKIGVWGFNPTYYLGITIFNLPIEELLFFFLIPYASIFIHYSLQYFFPKAKLSNKFVVPFTWVFIALLVVLIAMNMGKLYTQINGVFLVFALLLGLLDKNKTLHRFYISYMVILIPFAIVNGILTGSFIDEPIVWYNNVENLGIRFFTIPVEDFGYAFSMLYFSVFLIERFKTKTND